MKLVVDEDHSGALRRAALAWDRVATSELAITEVLRAVRRHPPSLLPAADAYDRRMLDGAERAGLATVSPGADARLRPA